MKVTHTGPERVYLPAHGDWVEPGDTVDVDDEAGVSLIEQGWTPPAPEKSKAELIEAANALGVDVKKSWSAARIAQAIDEHEQFQPGGVFTAPAEPQTATVHAGESIEPPAEES